jgi:hypothetical protein
MVPFIVNVLFWILLGLVPALLAILLATYLFDLKPGRAYLGSGTLGAIAGLICAGLIMFSIVGPHEQVDVGMG